MRILFEASSRLPKSLFLERESSAIHSGKLGDIIYALPTCKALGITHLYLNVVERNLDPLRNFSEGAAKSIIPLLLYQSYLKKVTVVSIPKPLEDEKSIPGIDYNLDRFRKVAWQRIGKRFLQLGYPFAKGRMPAHLTEHFASLYGLDLDYTQPWLESPNYRDFEDKIVVSLTYNWRTFPDSYWRSLLRHFPNLVFVGTESEYERARLQNVEYVKTNDALELASVIQSAGLFLGTVSFPYAIAEGLQKKRIVEICRFNLNAFPLSENGFVLPSRKADFFSLLEISKKSTFSFFADWVREIRARFQPINLSRRRFVKSLLARAVQAL